MNETVLTTIAFTGFTVAFFHAAIPTHWLPFVAAGRAQRWTHSKTLLITALAGTRPFLATALLVLILTIFGVALSSRVGTWFPRMAGALLIGLGLFYIWRQPSGYAHSHTHSFSKGDHGEGRHQHEHELRFSKNDRAICLAKLFAILHKQCLRFASPPRQLIFPLWVLSKNDAKLKSPSTNAASG